jgi:hypothetical protein
MFRHGSQSVAQATALEMRTFFFDLGHCAGLACPDGTAFCSPPPWRGWLHLLSVSSMMAPAASSCLRSRCPRRCSARASHPCRRPLPWPSSPPRYHLARMPSSFQSVPPIIPVSVAGHAPTPRLPCLIAAGCVDRIAPTFNRIKRKNKD